MIVTRFLQWAQTASASARAEGAGALARAFLGGGLTPSERHEAEAALMALLDDPAPCVRRAIAENLACSAAAPHAILVSLANDQSDIAAVVLGHSPVLSDAELIDCAAVGDAFAQAAIALRPELSAPVAAALAEVGAREALIALAVNLGADLPEFSMRRMVERFGYDGEVREALLARPQLPGSLRSELVSATARALSAFAIGCQWMSVEKAARVMREACEKATIIIATDAEKATDDGPRALVRHLRQAGELTPSLVLRALFCRDRSLFEAALAELADVPISRVAGLVGNSKGAGFAALYAKAKLPAALLAVFRAALAAQEEIGAARAAGTRTLLSRRMIDHVLTALTQTRVGGLERELGGLIGMLRRLEAEAARDESRELSAELIERGRNALDPDGFGRRESDIGDEIDSHVVERDRSGKPVAAFPFSPGRTRPRVEIDLAAIEAEIVAAA